VSEERLQEIKDSVKFQYILAKAKGYDNALLFTNEEEELIEEVERLNKENEHLRTALNTKESIIKEVREYIEEKEYIDYNPTLDGSESDSYNILPRSLSLYNEELDKLLDILEKEVK
jgi:regulator of replication initiation timing